MSSYFSGVGDLIIRCSVDNYPYDSLEMVTGVRYIYTVISLLVTPPENLGVKKFFSHNFIFTT